MKPCDLYWWHVNNYPNTFKTCCLHLFRKYEISISEHLLLYKTSMETFDPCQKDPWKDYWGKIGDIAATQLLDW